MAVTFGSGTTTALADWQAEGKRRFGADPLKWRFECPVCHHIQTPGDFKAIAAEPHSAYQSCIGRELPTIERARELATVASASGQKSPCDYAAYGLFRSGYYVLTPEGKAIAAFPFAETAAGGPDAP